MAVSGTLKGVFHLLDKVGVRFGGCVSEVVLSSLMGRNLWKLHLRLLPSSIPLLHKTKVLDPTIASVTVMDAVCGHRTIRVLFHTILIFSWILTSPFSPSCPVCGISSTEIFHHTFKLLCYLTQMKC